MEGQAIGAGVVVRLHPEPAFRADLEAAKSELAAIRADNVTLVSDCAGETAALAKRATRHAATVGNQQMQTSSLAIFTSPGPSQNDRGTALLYPS
jgi:hypothetical protein